MSRKYPRSTQATQRIYCDVEPAMKKRFDQHIPQGDRNFLLQMIIQDFVDLLDTMNESERTKFYGAIASKKVKVQQYIKTIKEATK